MLEQILSLPIEKKIGQLFFIGLSGAEINSSSRLLLEEISPGGICLFGRNIKSREQVLNFLNEIRKHLPVEPFLSIDQEGGVVDRLRRILTPMPAANTVKNSSDAIRLAEITAEVLRILGFNMNFAPVVDVIDAAREKFSNGLYSRGFGKSEIETKDIAGAYLGKLQEGGCLGCVKHFPGLGGSEVDSHEELPVVQISENEFFQKDLSPYIDLIKQEEVFAVMIAHAVYPKLDLQEFDSSGKLLPSSLSRNFVTKLLREELKFSGVTVTDDLEMGAIVKNYGIGEACKMAILAGEDMLAICADAEAVRKGFYAVLEAVRNREIAETRIDESLHRIANLKSLIQKPLPFNQERLEFLSNEILELSKK
ncbi:MAG: hypothetical protein M3033_17380 [Acidobacteriota bacterium]|nr:hypothetical protein [Acidobacteriota bacterium]